MRQHGNRTSCHLALLFDLGAHQAVEFLGKGDIPSDLYAPLQRGGKQVSSTFDDLDEVFLAAAYDAVRRTASFVDGYRTVLNRHKPGAHLFDVEKISAVDTAQQRLIVFCPVKIENFPRSPCHATSIPTQAHVAGGHR